MTDAPRVTISLTKCNLTHDLVKESGAFVMHLLGNGELLEASLKILMTLGGSSGRDGDKLSGLRTKPGVTGSPILLDALSYVEGRIVHSLDVEESTIFVADVVSAETLHHGDRLHINEAWGCPRNGSSNTKPITCRSWKVLVTIEVSDSNGCCHPFKADD